MFVHIFAALVVGLNVWLGSNYFLGFGAGLFTLSLLLSLKVIEKKLDKK